ncbi:hypothetical protein MPH_01228 [Macrophomina phaseolina MS6]|uniref:Uncharacterized protein n=1 Tax=Macrophomina phaseolina (strain MS6) TaxID=1126212 RepID=K2SXY5_MACPH|nr:hypothetical protein MPH_01228 [Macrophomina phaseolina MS6]
MHGQMQRQSLFISVKLLESLLHARVFCEGHNRVQFSPERRGMLGREDGIDQLLQLYNLFPAVLKNWGENSLGVVVQPLPPMKSFDSIQIAAEQAKLCRELIETGIFAEILNSDDQSVAGICYLDD